MLDRLIETAYAQNLDLMAGVRVLAARARLGLTIGELYPQQQQAVGSLSYNRIPGSIPYNIIDNTYWQAIVGAQAGWEIDLWGKIRRAVQSSDMGYLAAVAGYDNVLVTLLGDVATTYVQLRTLQKRIHIANENVARQKEALRIAENRLHAGTEGDAPAAVGDAAVCRTPCRRTEARAAACRSSSSSGRSWRTSSGS